MNRAGLVMHEHEDAERKPKDLLGHVLHPCPPSIQLYKTSHDLEAPGSSSAFASSQKSLRSGSRGHHRSFHICFPSQQRTLIVVLLLGVKSCGPVSVVNFNNAVALLPFAALCFDRRGF